MVLTAAALLLIWMSADCALKIHPVAFLRRGCVCFGWGG